MVIFFVHLEEEEGLFIYCSCGKRVICLLPMWKEKGYLFIAHVEKGLYVYRPCGRRRVICLFPMWKERGYMFIRVYEIVEMLLRTGPWVRLCCEISP